MNPNNLVVQLCMEGMQAEGAGRIDDARNLFLQAWERSTDDYDACVAAHFLARQQPTPADTLHWNRKALELADAIADERVEGFYPSLYLNMGHSHEQLGNQEEARRYYDLAAAITDRLQDGRYGDLVKQGIENGRKRVEK